ANMWHSFANHETYPHKAAVLAEHCAAVDRDPRAIERSAALGGAGGTGHDVSKLITEAEALTSLGVSLLTVGCNGPEYDLTAAEVLCRWRDSAGG
ncbi:MAG: LLM class F420-dependent oxidoreductase, partial [Mycobacteriaceae bacterium]|nr:LLM class F420-dependent oxidoreductase [Mycobacteriaceae bacterium]